MRVSIIGLGLSGKSTLFRALTGLAPEPPSGKPHRRLGRALVPDERVEFLAEVEHSVKKTYVEVNFLTPEGFTPEAGKSLSSELLGMVRGSDVLALVVRDFDDPSVMHPLGSMDSSRDLHSCFDDMIIADIAVFENRCEKLEKELARGRKDNALELKTLQRATEALTDGRFLTEEEWSADEMSILETFEPFTLKNGIVMWNVSEEKASKSDAIPEEIKTYCLGKGWDIYAASLSIEAEIMEMDTSDRDAFAQELGYDANVRDRFLNAVYAKMGLIRYYTAGPTESAARAIRIGDTAWDAAGKIHSDIQRGFIRAEVFSFEDLQKLGTVDEVRKAGKYRLEKKEYPVKDGDIILFRFAV